MSSNRFVVSHHEGLWCIGYRGLWYGGYTDKATALGVAVELASAAPELADEVVFEEADGSPVVFWKSPTGSDKSN